MPNAKFYDIERDGITQGLLGKWMDCREKGRLFLQGWTPKGVNEGQLFGTIVHACLEKAYAEIQSKKRTTTPSIETIQRWVAEIEHTLRGELGGAKMTADTAQSVETALAVAEAVLPAYFTAWAKDFTLQWVCLETSFAIPYTLRDGRKTVLRGKLDGAFTNPQLWLFETKTKSRIVEDLLVDRLPFDLQNCFYLYNLRRLLKKTPVGVMYNLIRRPGLKQGAKESLPEFAKRCADDVRTRPEWYFSRMEISVSAQELAQWEGELEDLLTEFYDWWQGKAGHFRNTGQCETAYGRCEMLHICAAKRMHHYLKRERVFRELEDY